MPYEQIFATYDQLNADRAASGIREEHAEEGTRIPIGEPVSRSMWISGKRPHHSQIRYLPDGSRIEAECNGVYGDGYMIDYYWSTVRHFDANGTLRAHLGGYGYYEDPTRGIQATVGELFDANQDRHNENGPARWNHKRGEEEYYRHGERHREGGMPAFISKSEVSFYENGQLHRAGGEPAQVTFHPNGAVASMKWAENGVVTRTERFEPEKRNALKRLFRRSGPGVHNFVIHRDDGGSTFSYANLLTPKDEG